MSAPQPHTPQPRMGSEPVWLRPMSGTFRSLGRVSRQTGRHTAGLWSIVAQTLSALFRGAVSSREVLRQCHEIGNRSLGFILVTMGFLGLISVYQVALQIQQMIPDFTMMGAAFIQMMVREFAPTIVGLMVATRVGSGIAAEIGSMVVTEQVDALRMCNADPVEYLIAPRTIASGLMMVCLTVVGVVVATITGMIMADTVFHVNPDTFLNLSLVRPSDVVLGLTKASSYGLAIPVIAGYAGLEARGGSAGVGWATTQAVVSASFAVVFLDFVISAISQMAFSV